MVDVGYGAETDAKHTTGRAVAAGMSGYRTGASALPRHRYAGRAAARRVSSAVERIVGHVTCLRTRQISLAR